MAGHASRKNNAVDRGVNLAVGAVNHVQVGTNRRIGDPAHIMAVLWQLEQPPKVFLTLGAKVVRIGDQRMQKPTNGQLPSASLLTAGTHLAEVSPGRCLEDTDASLGT